MMENCGITDLGSVFDERMFSEIKEKKKDFFYLQERRFLLEVVDEKHYPVEGKAP